MILAHPDFDQQIHINESEISEWIIEAPELFSKYLETLLNQTKGFDGQFVLSNKNKELDISKNIEIILNPITILYYLSLIIFGITIILKK